MKRIDELDKTNRWLSGLKHDHEQQLKVDKARIAKLEAEVRATGEEFGGISVSLRISLSFVLLPTISLSDPPSFYSFEVSPHGSQAPLRPRAIGTKRRSKTVLIVQI